ncbi:WD40-repeat-containing domain protein [Cerioporus squamosus]|nr:WD40-repeat-containing domain protein [Cerioporus squamosus]
MALPYKAVPLVAPGHTRPVTHLSFSPLQDDGTYVLISSCKDGNPMLRDWTGDWIGTFIGHKGAVWSSKLSPDTSRAASGSADFTAKIWDTYTGECLQSFPHNHIVRSVALSPSSSHLLTGGQEKKVRMFDLSRPDAEPDFLFDGAGALSHEGTVKSVVWVGDHTGVTAGEDGQIKWWDLRTRTLTTSLTFPNPITSMELSPQTNRIVVTSGKTVSFIPALLNGEEREILKGHHGPVHCVEYSPDGEMFASGSEDGTIRLWQTTPGKSYGLWQGVPANGG